MASSSQVRRSRREHLESQRLAKAKKERRNKILFTAGGVLILILVVAVAIWGVVSATKGTGTEEPPNATTGGNGIHLNPWTDGAPTLEVFSDFNCGTCRTTHLAWGSIFEQVASEGKANVVFISMSFVAESSRPAAIAAACSDFQNVFPEYHHELFISANEGLDTVMLRETIPAKVGLTGEALTAFQTCVDTQATGGFVDKQAAYANQEKVIATPVFHLDGEDISTQLWDSNTKRYDPDLLRELLGMS